MRADQNNTLSRTEEKVCSPKNSDKVKSPLKGKWVNVHCKLNAGLPGGAVVGGGVYGQLDRSDSEELAEACRTANLCLSVTDEGRMPNGPVSNNMGKA